MRTGLRGRFVSLTGTRERALGMRWTRRRGGDGCCCCWSGGVGGGVGAKLIERTRVVWDVLIGVCWSE